MHVTPALLFAAAELTAAEPTLPAAAGAQLKITQPNAALAAAQPTTTDGANATGTGSTPPDDHLEQLRAILQMTAAAKQPAGRRDPTAQEPQRRLEDHIRQNAVKFYEQTAAAGGTLQQAAERLWICPRTLRQWSYDCHRDETLFLGRPMVQASAEQRSGLLDWLREQGPGVGVPRLRREFPNLARAELADLLSSYRDEVGEQQWRSVHVLHWQVPGRVWAMDFAEPSLLKATCALPPIDDQYPYLLAVRDLASGYQLAWLPLAQANAATVQSVLGGLFAQHGVPLILKSDNGGPFRAEETKAFVESAGSFCLFSPPACPGYNGSIEAAIGGLKKRTQEEAARRGHVGSWTSADVAAALAQANTGHPPRLNGRTPAQVWQARTGVSTLERFRFAMAVESQRERARQELGIDLETSLDHWAEGRVDRKAIERALVEHDYLLFTRRRIPLTIPAGKMTSGV